MSAGLNVTNAAKTATFQMRINPEIKERVETIYANCGMTLTDAINVFIQQSINADGLPFLVVRDNRESLREQAITRLAAELKRGEGSVKCEADWISEEDMKKDLHRARS